MRFIRKFFLLDIRLILQVFGKVFNAHIVGRVLIIGDIVVLGDFFNFVVQKVVQDFFIFYLEKLYEKFLFASFQILDLKLQRISGNWLNSQIIVDFFLIKNLIF